MPIGVELGIATICKDLKGLLKGNQLVDPATLLT